MSFGVFAAGAVAQLASVRLSSRRALGLAAVALTVGLALVAVGAVVVSLAAFVSGGVIAGAGVGLLFRLALGVAGSLASDETRGEVLAAMFLAAYPGSPCRSS